MEEKEGKNDLLNGECITNSDVGFCSFYYLAVKRLLDIDNNANISYLYRYVKILNEYCDNFCRVKAELEGNYMIRLLKTSLYFRFVYLYKNAALLSSAVAFHFRKVYEQNPSSIERLIKKKQVNICSIGGCSVPDIVAIIAVLKCIAIKNDIELDFRVTIIDFCRDWKNTCIMVLSCLGDFREPIRKINFIQCNLANTNAWTPKTLKAIREANVLTMVNYACNFYNKGNIVEKICKELKSEAMLFIMDYPVRKRIELYFRINDLGNFHLIDVELYDYHTLDIEAVKFLRTSHQRHFGSEKLLRSNIGCNLFASVWMKGASDTDTRHKDNLKCIFQKNAEKYKPEQIFLSNGRWKKMIRKKLTGKKKKIKKFVRQQEEKRNDILGKFIHEKKEVDSLQYDLLDEVQSLDNDGKEFLETNEGLLDDYLIQKKQYSIMKKTAYFASLKQIDYDL